MRLALLGIHYRLNPWGDGIGDGSHGAASVAKAGVRVARKQTRRFPGRARRVGERRGTDTVSVPSEWRSRCGRR